MRQKIIFFHVDAQQKPSAPYVVNPGDRYYEMFTLFSDPGFPNNVDSVATAKVRARDPGMVLETSTVYCKL